MDSSWFFLIPRTLYLGLRCLGAIGLAVLVSFSNRPVLVAETVGLLFASIFFIMAVMERVLRPLLIAIGVIDFLVGSYFMMSFFQGSWTWGRLFPQLLLAWALVLIDFDLWYRYNPFFDTYQKAYPPDNTNYEV